MTSCHIDIGELLPNPLISCFSSRCDIWRSVNRLTGPKTKPLRRETLEICLPRAHDALITQGPWDGGLGPQRGKEVSEYDKQGQQDDAARPQRQQQVSSLDLDDVRQRNRAGGGGGLVGPSNS